WNYTFQGMRYDPMTGLLFSQTRPYDPDLGIWLSQDIFYFDGPNLYGFVTNNPINGLDPNGLATITVEDVSGASFYSHWAGGTGDTVEIIGAAFLKAVQDNPTVKAHIEGIYNTIRSEAKKLFPTMKYGETKKIQFNRLNMAFEFEGKGPTSRWWAFGTAYIDAHVEIVVKKVCDAKGQNAGLQAVGQIRYKGHDRYQWGTAKAYGIIGNVGAVALYAGGLLCGNIGTILTLGMGSGATITAPKDFNSEWSWLEPIKGLIRVGVGPGEEVLDLK
ncbi:MAG: RHS repeat-associated core domain-containing protein, partial [Phycisphaerales bacterium]|nr:RHS repeat-associated core domain-containing protein [Phycisphaerales bacterium]